MKNGAPFGAPSIITASLESRGALCRRWKVADESLGLNYFDAFEISGDRMAGILGLGNKPHDRLADRARADDLHAQLRMARKRLLIDGLAAGAFAFHGRIARCAELHEFVEQLIFQGRVEHDHGLPSTC